MITHDEQPRQRGPRRDAAENRERLLSAARQVFAELGPDAALEEIAKVAAVSRTTLYRNFATREELAATVYEQGVTVIEERARALGDRPDAVVELFDLVLDLEMENRGISRVLMGADIAWFTDLSARAEAAVEPHLARGLRAGVVRPGTDMADVLLAFHMASTAIADHTARGLPSAPDRIRHMLHRALFDIDDDPA